MASCTEPTVQALLGGAAAAPATLSGCAASIYTMTCGQVFAYGSAQWKDNAPEAVRALRAIDSTCWQAGLTQDPRLMLYQLSVWHSRGQIAGHSPLRRQGGTHLQSSAVHIRQAEGRRSGLLRLLSLSCLWTPVVP